MIQKTLMIQILGLFCVLNLLGPSANAGASTAVLGELAVQDAGRLKPFDTFARETLQLIHGRQTYNGRSAVEVVMTWMLVPEHWEKEEFLKIGYAPLKEALKVPLEKSYFSPRALMANDRLALLVTDLQEKQSRREKLSPFDQAVQTLQSQIGIFMQIRSADHVRLVPPIEGDRWLSLRELPETLQPLFHNITTEFVEFIRSGGGNSANLREAVEVFQAGARAQNPALYPSQKLLNLEISYNQWAPFQKAWIFLVLALIAIALEYFFTRKVFYRVAWVFTALGFISLITGFALRVYISGRPPVSNMYESVIWVSFGVLLFSMVFEFIYRRRFTMAAGSLVATLCLVVADLGANILDPSLHPLEPVLRSNFWLIVHVLTITISYAAFFLAFALGDVGLVCYLKDSKRFKSQIDFLALGCYRAIQVGVVLLAAGTILGGVWADYSWGRFWGWDPKETWAFIALMGYLALLHARLIGWVRQLGILAGSVGAFSLVLMAWYGVNYVLGAGLHSYGFGAGGVQYVAAFVAAHLIFLTYVVSFVRAKSAVPN